LQSWAGIIFWQADFSWQGAVTASGPSTFTFASLTPEKFDRFRTTQAKPNIERECKDEAVKRVGFDGRLPVRVASFCECYASVATEIITKEDMAYQETNNKYPVDFEQRMVNATLVKCAAADREEDIHRMSNEELAEFFAVKECSADVYLVCTSRAKARERYNSPEVQRNRDAINRKLDQQLFKEEVDYAVNTLGLDANEAHHGHMVKECGWFSCSWVYKKLPYKEDR
jgi:hypothetical protein